MKADHFSQNKTLAFPFTLSEEATGPEVEGPTRFARALKRARMARGWTQAKLAEHLSITRRSIVSWETGDRIPGIGMVVLLLDTLFPDETLSLHHELLCAYIVDDVEREAHRQDAKHTPNRALLQQRLRGVIEQILLLPERAMMNESESQRRGAETPLTPQWDQHESPQPPSQAEGEPALEPLFTLMAQLQHHPELIPVARDFIREMASDE